MSNKQKIDAPAEVKIIEHFNKLTNSLLGAAGKALDKEPEFDKIYEKMCEAQWWFSHGMARKLQTERGKNTGLEVVEGGAGKDE